MKRGRPKKQKQQKSLGVKIGAQILRKSNPKTFEHDTDLELLSLLIPPDQAKLLLEEFGTIKNLLENFDIKDVRYLMFTALGTTTRILVLQEIVRRLKTAA